ncbi:TonB-dependent receptor [Flavobacteriaceae bacterium]|nr:TonB-dependent receptor [Flavobacteriaceae bacterium]
MNFKSFSILFLLGCSHTLSAQIDSLQTISLKPVEVSATRITNSLLETTWSVSKLDFAQQQDQMQQLTFSDYVQAVPGLFALNSNNFSQDLRISIRGFGARSAFGIRGIKILVDGIPETTPDGQGQIDNLALGSIASVEVIRGPSSLLFGNASGGVISIQTKDVVEKNYIKPGLTLGRFGMENLQIEAGVNRKNTTLIISANKIKTNGYRSQSGFESSEINARIKHIISSKTDVNLVFNYTDSPVAEDPGGLDFDSVVENRQQARDRNVDYRTQEAVEQFKTGLSVQHKFNSKLNLSTYGFYVTRDFNAKLPFDFGGSVYLDRTYFGQGAQLSYKTGGTQGHNFQLGYSWSKQDDWRKRYYNNKGFNGNFTLFQKESFNALGFYVMDEISFGKNKILGGLRYDSNKLGAIDYFTTDGNDSDRLSLNSWNYSLGINHKINNKSVLFSSIGTSFETPVLSELSANPDGGGGFNSSLSAQKALNKEIGYRYFYNTWALEAVIFDINTSNDLVPYELEAFPGRTFYRNAGKTNRTGFELSATKKTSEFLSTTFSYSYSDFTYKSFQKRGTDVSGNNLPGIPKHMATVSAEFIKEGWNINLMNRFQGNLYADDANLVQEKVFLVTNLNVSFRSKNGAVQWIPFFGVNNVFNTIYNDNIRVNAFGGRYYEPAPTRNIFGGVRLVL